MLKLNEQVFGVNWHTDMTVTICIVPFDINTSKLISGHVEVDQGPGGPACEFPANIFEPGKISEKNICSLSRKQQQETSGPWTDGGEHFRP